MRARGQTRARDGKEVSQVRSKSRNCTEEKQAARATDLFSLKEFTSLYMTGPVPNRCLVPPPCRRRRTRDSKASSELRAILVLASPPQFPSVTDLPAYKCLIGLLPHPDKWFPGSHQDEAQDPSHARQGVDEGWDTRIPGAKLGSVPAQAAHQVYNPRVFEDIDLERQASQRGETLDQVSNQNRVGLARAR